MNPQKIIISAALIVAVALGIFYLNSQKVDRSSGNNGAVTVTPRVAVDSAAGQTSTSSAPSETPLQKSAASNASPVAKKPIPSQDKSKKYDLAKEITTPDGFINTDGKPVTISQYIGKKVILIDFWTYSCINCQRTTPYLNAWYEKYKDKGLVIIGIHTPEFEFEKVYQNVLDATKKEGIKYPVVLDNDYSTWTAYQNRFWPRKYLIDIDGYVIYDHIGEGEYEETEKKIQEALSERMTVLWENGTINTAVTKEIATQNGAKSPETYFGRARNREQAKLLFPKNAWDIQPEFAQNNSANASIVYTYTAKDVFFVAEAGTETLVEVLLDGKPLGKEAGVDIIKTSDGKSVAKIKEARLYKLIQGEKSETHKLELRIQSPGLKAFTFTFG